MIKFAPGIKTSKNEVMYCNRGMSFESRINISNKYYHSLNKAIIYKKPTPIKIVKASKSKSTYRIDEAYFLEPSTTDYNGIYKGRYIDFEAKETSSLTSFPISNIHLNQINHLFEIVEHGGIGFLLVEFTRLNMMFLIDCKILKSMEKIGRKSISLEVFKKEGFLIPSLYNCPVNYLDIVDKVYFK